MTATIPKKIIDDWSKRWIGIGLSTEPVDFDRAIKAALRVYDIFGVRRPQEIICTPSPYKAIHSLCKTLLKRGKDENSLKLARRIRMDVSKQIDLESKEAIQIWQAIGRQVYGQVGSHIQNEINLIVKTCYEITLNKNNNIIDIIFDERMGAFLAGWGAYISLLRDVLGWYEPALEKFAIDEELICSCGWGWINKDILIMSNRPKVINLDTEGRLHSETGPSIKYRDGWSLYHWHGISVPAHWIEQRDRLKISEVLQTQNVEQRAAGSAIIGWKNMISQSHYQYRIIDGNPDSDIGALIELTIPGLPMPERFLQAICPRNGTIIESVPFVSDIDNTPIETAIGAQAWRDGLPMNEYQHPPYRT